MSSSISSDRASLWQARLHEQQLSGLSIAAFCSLNQLSPASFYQWKRKLTPGHTQPQATAQPKPHRATPLAGRPPFVQLAFPAQPMALTGIEVLLPDGTIIRLPAHCAETLVALLPMLRKPSSSTGGF